MTTTENTLTQFQKELFDFTIEKHYDMTGGMDATLDEELRLVSFIQEFDALEQTELYVFKTGEKSTTYVVGIGGQGKKATKEQKFIFWFRQNFKDIERIFNLA